MQIYLNCNKKQGIYMTDQPNLQKICKFFLG